MTIYTFLPGMALVLLSLGFAVTATARPVSYPGGITVMQLNDADANSIHLHYSPTAHYSLGYRGILYSEADWNFHGLQANYLVKRWNRLGSQANFYFKTALGVGIDGGSDERSLAGLTELAGDWETRRYFISYQSRYNAAANINHFFQQTARVGIAPYLGSYGDIHTWLMVQTDYDSEEQALRVTPLVRFFKAEYLVEAGVSLDGDLLLNGVIRF